VVAHYRLQLNDVVRRRTEDRHAGVRGAAVFCLYTEIFLGNVSIYRYIHKQSEPYIFQIQTEPIYRYIDVATLHMF
jgi:hypothetical protein